MEEPTENTTEMEEQEPSAEEIVEAEEEAVAAPAQVPAQENDIPKIERQEVKRGRGRPKAKPETAQQQPVAPASRYVAFKQEEQHGIYDTQTKTLYTQEACIAELLSKVDRIERSIA